MIVYDFFDVYTDTGFYFFAFSAAWIILISSFIVLYSYFNYYGALVFFDDKTFFNFTLSATLLNLDIKSLI
jgi:hypothetical protein